MVINAMCVCPHSVGNRVISYKLEPQVSNEKYLFKIKMLNNKCPFKTEYHLGGEPVFYSKPFISRPWRVRSVTLKTYIWEPRGWKGIVAVHRKVSWGTH